MRLTGFRGGLPPVGVGPDRAREATASHVEAGTSCKSTHSGSGGGSNCIEVAACTNASPGIAIRDTKYREGAVLAAARPEWSAFVSAVKAGAFDA